jgi:hypothetical protein
LWLVPPPWSKEQNHSVMSFMGGGPIAFDYGSRTHRLGADLDEANAHYVIQKMRERVKSLGANDEAT